MSWFTALARFLAPRRPLSMGAMALIVFATILVDQASKCMAARWLDPVHPTILIPNFLNFWYAENTGAAFSSFTGKTYLLAIFSAIISIGVVGFAWRLKPEELPLRLPLGLILGGAVGNLIDRIRLAYVVDFIDVHWFWKAHYPIFNIADSAVCIGVALFVASFFVPAAAQEPPLEHAEKR